MEMCRNQVELESRVIAQDASREADQTIQTLRELFAGLRMIDAPKTLILISEGFVMSDEAMIVDLGRMAGEARTSLYALKLDNQLFDITDARMPINPFADRQARGEGLELLKGSSCSPAQPAARCSRSPARGRRSSSGSNRSSRATTCSASNRIRRTRTGAPTRSGSTCRGAARWCDRVGSS
jgi:hypothetical protein